jgi:hypothetical protein
MYSFNTVEEFLKANDAKPIPFPEKKIYFNDKQIQNMFIKLQIFAKQNNSKRLLYKPLMFRKIKSPSSLNKFRNASTIIINSPKDYYDYNQLSDMFMEQIRVKCRLVGSKYTPFEYFEKHLPVLARSCIQQYKEITPRTLRETLWKQRNAKECTSFRPNLIIHVAQILFGSKKLKGLTVIDPSSGWGDRMLGAMASGMDYTGVDPNTKLQAPYKAMIEFFKSKTSIEPKMICGPFQTTKLTKKYKLAFTSPPYFDLEHYSDEKTQSTASNPTEIEWFESFLRPYVYNLWNSIEDEGYMVLIINHLNADNQYCTGLRNLVAKFDDSLYHGVLGYANQNMSNPQPVWIWQKTKTINTQIFGTPYISTVNIRQRRFNSITYNVEFAAFVSMLDSKTPVTYSPDIANDPTCIALARATLARKVNVTLMVDDLGDQLIASQVGEHVFATDTKVNGKHINIKTNLDCDDYIKHAKKLLLLPKKLNNPNVRVWLYNVRLGTAKAVRAILNNAILCTVGKKHPFATSHVETLKDVLSVGSNKDWILYL